MQLFLDYIPIVIFFAAYLYKDIYFATIVLMIAMPIIFALQWMRTKRVNRIFLASTALILLLGGATLFFHNPTFLYWKPTALNWLIALVFLGSYWIGEKTIVERMMGGAAALDAQQWKILNMLWIGFFVVVGAANIYVAYNFSQDFWVNFKLFGMLGLTLLFVVIQSIWLTFAMKKSESPTSTNGES